MNVARKAKKSNDGLFTDQDTFLFKEGSHFRLYEKLGAHLMRVNDTPGVQFAVWAPNACNVSIIGGFNGWDQQSHPLQARPDGSGIWQGFIAGLAPGTSYKYQVVSQFNNYQAAKGDPFAYYWKDIPQAGSIVWDLNYQWQDQQWMTDRHKYNALTAPFSIYEVHLGSWRRKALDGTTFINYREMAHYLVDYVKEMGFTHVEFLPVMEHPFYGSWGYQSIGQFAPTSRYGTPQDFMYLIDRLHNRGIGVILDWVPSHFPTDEYGLAYFDGTHLYEHADPRQGVQPDWNSFIFNLGRGEVQSFLISNVMFWLDKYHVDGIRVDAVTSMLYLDFSRKPDEWVANKYGGRENLEAIDFLKRFNQVVYQAYPDVQTIAEESTTWPMVSRPIYAGGLGFGMKWNMGWMHDTLDYFSQDPLYRKYRHQQLAFNLFYAFTENFVLVFSHDEVVYGKGSLISRMPGSDEQKFANLRLLFGYMFANPGKKLIFMGGEFGQWQEWNHDRSLDWQLLQYPNHQGIQQWVRDLNYLYQSEPALHTYDFQPDGFEWIDYCDWENSVVAFLRKGPVVEDTLVIICNFTPITRDNYRIGVPAEGLWREILNSDAREYQGSGQGNLGGVTTTPTASHGRENSITITLPPLAILFFKQLDTNALAQLEAALPDDRLMVKDLSGELI